ncbi:uncharacterized protein LOC111901644 [Lactuca sativa]|uniref:uncharacterized protein LOC111901644 n=1 Tax=Lactuca sativa TaxID=4236 RepID=UPI000CD9C713|nr:uncharacterized protein LOC111901644 [Lactuca sativa]
MVSKKVQSKSICIDVAINQLQNVITFFKKFRNEGFVSSINIAKTIALEMGVEPTFPYRRNVTRKKFFDESDIEEEEIQSLEEYFKINYFYVVVDVAIVSLNTRFEQLKHFESIFGFLSDSKILKSLDENKLRECCIKLANTFSNDIFSDVDSNDLFTELKFLQKTLPNDIKSAVEILEFVKVEDCYPNVFIAYRILLTIPVTVASAERNFSKLKLLKNYLRSSMSQERLNDLAILCIEKDMLDKIDLEDIINDFASQKARRSIFL